MPNDGARFASRVSSLLTDAHIKVRTAMMAVESDNAHVQRGRAMEAMEQELGPKLRPIFQEMADDPDVAPDMRALLHRIGNPGHQTDWLLEIFSILGLMLGAGPAAAAGKIQVMQRQSLKRWGDVSPDPSMSAALVARVRRSRATAAVWAADSGMTAGDKFDAVIDLAHRSPAEGEVLVMLRRGLASEAMAVDALQDSGLRDQWISRVLALVHGPLDPGVAVAAAVQGHIDQSTMTNLIAQNGIDPNWAQAWYETAGNPPGTEEMLHLLRRGLISETEVIQGIRESRVKNKYIPAIMQMRHVIPPMRTVVTMMAKGVVTADRGAEMLAQLGFYPDVIAGMVREATVTRHEKSRDIAQGTILTLYEDQHIDRGTAMGKLVKLGYDSTEIELLLGLADTRRLARFHNAAIARVHTLYVGHHIDRAHASRDLDTLIVNADERGQLIKLWDMEREANVRRLTEAQYAKAHRNGLLTDDEFVAALLTLGYLEADAKILLGLQGLK